MNKPWQPYARHILDAIAKIQRIQALGDLTQDDILYDAALRNLQTLASNHARSLSWRIHWVGTSCLTTYGICNKDPTCD